MNSSNKHKRNNFSDMELCIAIKSKAQSSMQKCHQNQMNQLNTQLSRQQHRSHINHRDRDHLKKQQENQRQTPQENQQHINRSNRSKTSITSIIIELIQNYCQRLCQLLLPLLMLLLLLGLAQPSAASPGSSSSSRRDALLAYYKRAQLRQSDSYGIPEYQQQQQQQQTLREAAAFDFEDLTPTGNVVSVLSNADRLRKRSATSTTAQTAAPTTTTTAAPVTTTVAATAAEAAASSKATEKCEPKVLETLPDEPFYDFSELAADAARQFTEFLTYKYANTPIPNDEQTRSEVSRRANAIASYALNEDENLLAFAIAAPSIHTVVVKFRDNVTIPPDQVHNKAYLGSYWRELGAAWNSSDGTREWGAPFRDCNLLTGRWLWPFRISFTEQPIKIVAAAFVAADEDVCNDGLEEVFGRRHGCDRNTTFCLLTENKPMATRDVYTCLCRESFYLPNSTLQGFRGDLVEMSEGYDNFSCVPCPGGCTNCDLHGVCLNFQEEDAINLDACLRLLVAIVLGACILCCVVLSVIVFRQRKCKAIASGMWTVLETILLGIVLLYASVAVHFFPASTERCLLEPWLREIGFITCYGAIILKLYRHLVDFRTRKAHRWVLRDVDLLKYLGTMVFAVVCYMAAFTASSLDLLESAQLKSLREASTNTCHPLKWELVTQTSEMLILCFGLHLAIASRNANTQFRERQFLVTTLTLEFLVSSSFYFLRFVYLPEMSPGAILLALFIRSQLTNSFALGLIFVPKLWYQHKQCVQSLFE
ncbi:metabotropic glycine receptor isoform X7 [Drosophila sulfurigaster albostrigata]|uniref:metabotropic glycine receptor isoform X7 n=1 Tax=Drosophila sulfurigaster albostrigata TaxID=89887 RepID=UPI002D21ED09|nr:metabotropic glycine receptor isoform X7 [Drosophila sulfurigaster albostrigata]